MDNTTYESKREQLSKLLKTIESSTISTTDMINTLNEANKLANECYEWLREQEKMIEDFKRSNQDI